MPADRAMIDSEAPGMAEHDDGITCSNRTCAAVGVFRPVLELRCVSGHVQAEAFPELRVCARHAERLTAAILLSDEFWSSIEADLCRRGLRAPDRALTTLRIEPLGGAVAADA